MYGEVRMSAKILSKPDRFLGMSLFLLSFVYYLPTLKLGIKAYDEGIILVGAERVMRGEVPYRDFWSIYPAGQYYVLGLLFKVFGSSLLTERLYDIAVRAALSTLIFLISRKAGLSYRAALLSWGMSLLWIDYSFFPVYPMYTALVLLLLGCFFFLDYILNNHPATLSYSGICIGIGILFRHDIAAYTSLASIITLGIIHYRNIKLGMQHGAFLILGMLCAILPAGIYAINSMGLQHIVDQLIFTPAEIIPQYRKLPYPLSLSATTIQFILFPIILVVGFLSSIFLITKHAEHRTAASMLFLVSITGLMCGYQAGTRADTIHLLPIATMCMILIPWLFSLGLSCTPNKISRNRLMLVMVILLSCIFIAPFVSKLQGIEQAFLTTTPSSQPTKADYASLSATMRQTINYIQGQTKTDDYIYIGVKNHDQFLMNEVILYYLSDRRPATRYHELHPGITNQPQVQQEIITELKRTSTKLIVLTPENHTEPNDSSIDNHLDILDNYIQNSYKIVNIYGNYEIWIRH